MAFQKLPFTLLNDKLKNMQFKYQKLILCTLFMSVFATSCFKDLDTIPLDPDEVTSAVAYDNPDAYRQVLAKLYAGLAVSGQQGPSGQADIAGIDEGFGQYLRGLWYHQELPTDEAVIGWNDQTIKDFHEQDWDANDVFIAAFYSRIFYQVSLCNEFIRETTEEKLSERKVDDALRTEIEAFRAEARFLRALSYWHALDHFRAVPFVTEDDVVGSFFPEQASASELYDYIESELKAIEGDLIAPRQNEYGRADQAAAWALLSKLYLNAEVYVGKDAYSDCLAYCQRIIDAGYNLEPNYEHLFMADNHTSDEIIFPVAFDGVSTKTWGGMTFIIHATVGGTMVPSDYGIDSGWGGTRSTAGLVNKFPVIAGGSGGGFVVPRATSEEHAFLYLPGSYQGWRWKPENSIASPMDDGIYEGYAWMDAGTQFKITETAAWTPSYGDNDGDGILDLDGDNLEVEEAGFYKIAANLNDLTYSLEPTQWGLIGSATAGGWDSDTDMTYNAEVEAWEIETSLSAGEIKFRANDDWALNMGDTGADGLLLQDGDNIRIENSGGYRVRLYLNKPDYTYSIEATSSDGRGLFYTDGQSLEINDIAQFPEGYPVIKFTNLNRDGSTGSDLTHPDTDFPMFRLADVYLMAAEAHLRGGGGDFETALGYVNEVRARAYQGPVGNIDADTLTLDFLLDERARELFWECHRRTDLVRFGQFSDGTYMWPWKGNVKEGAPVSSHFDVFPIPSSDIGANPNLVQNTGY